MKMNFREQHDILKEFDDEEKCYNKMVMARWNGDPSCPYCDAKNPYLINDGLGYKCRNKNCLKKFTVKTGLVFEKSRIPLRTWFAALHACTITRMPLSSGRLARNLKIKPKAAWYIIFRIRETLKQNEPSLIKYNTRKQRNYIN